MTGIQWIAVDERGSGRTTAGVGRMLAAGGGAFAAVTLEIDANAEPLEDIARALCREFQVAIVPVVTAERLASEPDRVMQGLDALVRSGVMRTAAFERAVVLVRANTDRLPDARLIEGLRARMVRGEMPMIGLINRAGMLMRRPPDYDFLLHWPPMHGVPRDADDMAIEFLRGAMDHSPCAHSVLIGDLGDSDATEAEAGPGSALWRLWLESARRFVTNRGSGVLPYVFVRLGDAAHQDDFLHDLASALRVAGRAGADTSLPADPVELPQEAAPARIAVIIHLHFPELWPEFFAAVAAMPESVHLYISTPFALRSAVAARIRRDCPEASVFGVRNRGRDVLPFLHVMRSIGIERYEYVLKLHGKKSVHMEGEHAGAVLGGGEAWRRHAINELAGSTQRIARLLEAMDADPGIGLVAPAGQLFDQGDWSCGSDKLMHRLCSDFGVSRSASHFSAGTMFWLRPRAIRRLVESEPSMLDFEREAGQLDRTLHHTLERAFAHFAVCEDFLVVDSAALVASCDDPAGRSGSVAAVTRKTVR